MAAFGPWREYALCLSCIILVLTFPLIGRLIAVVGACNGCSEHRDGFDLTGALYSMFCRELCLQDVGVRQVRSPFWIALSPFYCLFLPKDLCFLPNIRARVHLWLFEYHLFKVYSSEEHSSDPASGDFDGYAAGDEADGDWSRSELTGGPGLSHCVSILVH